MLLLLLARLRVAGRGVEDSTVLRLLLLVLLETFRARLLLLEVLVGEVDAGLDGEARQLEPGDLIDVRAERILVVGAHVGIVGQFKEVGLSGAARARPSSVAARVGRVCGQAHTVALRESVAASDPSTVTATSSTAVLARHVRAVEAQAPVERIQVGQIGEGRERRFQVVVVVVVVIVTSASAAVGAGRTIQVGRIDVAWRFLEAGVEARMEGAHGRQHVVERRKRSELLQPRVIKLVAASVERKRPVPVRQVVVVATAISGVASTEATSTSSPVESRHATTTTTGSKALVGTARVVVSSSAAAASSTIATTAAITTTTTTSAPSRPATVAIYGHVVRAVVVVIASDTSSATRRREPGTDATHVNGPAIFRVPSPAPGCDLGRWAGIFHLLR